MNIALFTFGCYANKDNSDIIRAILREHNFTDEQEADIIILNTCAVKASTKSKIYNLIEKYKNKRLIITGCFPIPLKNEIRGISKDAALVSSHNLFSIPQIVKNFFPVELLEQRKEIKLVQCESNNIIQISEGCQCDCSFCITKVAKGKLFSYPMDKILDYVKNLSCDIIHITSQDNAAFGLDSGRYLLPDLINSILELKPNLKIKIGMMNPINLIKIQDEMFKIYENRNIIKFLHIPMQSCSNKIFRKINGINIVTDVIVGYPTETEEDFLETYNLIKILKFDVLNISKFTSHKQTEAFRLKQLRSEVIKERSKRLSIL